jgi:hypothetical protein
MVWIWALPGAWPEILLALVLGIPRKTEDEDDDC